MRRDINDYSLYVFDLDGTLYDQRRLRMKMGIRLIGYYMLHPFGIKELLGIMRFRAVKDRSQSAYEPDMINQAAQDVKMDPKKLYAAVRKWIYELPLSLLYEERDERLIAFMDELRKRGKKVVVLSDYPAADKLAALSVTADGIYDPDDPRIDELKPSPKGLLTVMADCGVSPEETLMIGDREEKDGMCASAAGSDSLILCRNIRKRRSYEK
ncbi:MAG: HAD-IA family hydrolase [Lachnospiraceae bacterium]|nr:HAD-IA family hydrolase [Lachnospiraceae bacterium]